jgi:Holliday junction resolvase RusA-like endonuclease
MPTPRPRASRFGVYNPKKYTDYKKSLITYLLSLNIPNKDYDYIHAKFYVSYPKSTPKKNLIDNFPLRQCFDCDNVIKGLCDSLEQANVIGDDRQISSMYIEKYRTIKPEGYIEFELQTTEENPILNGK